jgi:hypothetical protein
MSITRLHDSDLLAHEVTALDATSILSSDLIVTPVRTKENRLKLITWRQHSDGTLSRLADSGSSGPFVSNVACPPISSADRIITALREGESLALMEWKCDSAGALSVITSGVFDSTATAVGVSLGAGQTYITARRGPHGGLELVSWKEGGGGGKLGSAQAGGISTLGRPLLADTLITPVVLACAERLRLIAWAAAANGGLTRTGDSGNQAGEVSRISCAHIGGKWATAVRDGNGRLKVIFWQMDAGSPKRIGDSGPNGPEIIDVDIQGLDFNEIGFGQAEAEWRVVTAVRAKNSRLRLLTWSWKQASGNVVKINDSGDQPEPISLLRLLDLGNTRFVTVVRDDSTKTKDKPGHLKLITWNVT